MAESTISGALCGIMEKALIEKGVDATLAKVLAKRACEPVLQAAPKLAKKGARGAVKVAKGAERKRRAQNRKLSEAFKEANRRLRKKNGELREGKSQSDVARLAQRLRKKM